MQGWTIYQNPRDFPGQYVTRRWVAVGGEPINDPEPLYVGQSLQAAREVIPWDACCMNRQPDDDPVVLETWI